MSLLSSLFDPSGLAQHGFCLTWDPELLWLYAGSDTLILLLYLSIPISLIWLLRRRRDRTYHWIGYLLVAFILADATTYALAVLTLWVPSYAVEGLAKALTAAVSVATASILWMMAPGLADMLSPAQLTNLNAKLSQTLTDTEKALGERLDVERQLRDANLDLEDSVSRHAEELRLAGARLAEVDAARAATEGLLARTEAEYQASFEASTVGKVQGTALRPSAKGQLRLRGPSGI